LAKLRSHYKEKIKNVACFIKGVTGAAGWNIGTWIKNMRYNLFCRQIETDILERKFIIINKYCTLDLHPKAKLVLNAPFIMGYKRIEGSKLESRLLIEENGRMEIKYGSYTVYYGADIQVFKGAHLEIGGDASVNVGLNLICANHISIGRWTGGGRNVTIRDNNGEHHISIRGYKTSIPIVIKEHVWLTENCTIMPGTTIEAGAIISARSVVQGHVPSFSIVSGDPAKVIETKVYWKS
jgi:Acetyltransferase (isoleucine patch superfamily)